MNAKAEARICTSTWNEKRMEELSGAVQNNIMRGQGKMDKTSQRTTDKSDRATTDQVLDPRTRLVLYKLLNKETLHSIHGCVSTGKEANVYYATTPSAFLDANGVTGSLSPCT